MEKSVRVRWGAALAAGAAVCALATPAAAATVSEPVLSGLAGPLGLAVGDDGTVYVNEFFGGAVKALDEQGRLTTLAEGQIGGGVAAQGKGHVVYTQSADPESGGAPETLLVRTNPGGGHRTIASLSEFEERTNPDAGQTYGIAGLTPECAATVAPFLPTGEPVYSGIVESNPYAVTIHKGRYLVADAAGNSIVEVAPNGRVSLVAVLPPVPVALTADLVAGLEADTGLELDCLVGKTWLAEPVPTDVEVGPDGAYYVSSLPGLPEAPGSGGVFRVDPRTGAVTRIATGGSGVTDLAVAPDGTVYVAELFAGRISRVQAGTLVAAVELASPGAVEVAPDGSLYATTGVFGPAGSVVRIAP